MRKTIINVIMVIILQLWRVLLWLLFPDSCFYHSFSRFISVSGPTPFKPQVTSETDTRYFDDTFTAEPVSLTPPQVSHHLESIDEETMDTGMPYFEKFSYHGSKTSLASSVMSFETTWTAWFKVHCWTVAYLKLIEFQNLCS